MYRVDSDENTADFFTKGLGGQKHSKFGSESLGFDLSFLYSSRKTKNHSQNEGEQSSALLLSQKRGSSKLNHSRLEKRGSYHRTQTVPRTGNRYQKHENPLKKKGNEFTHLKKRGSSNQMNQC